MVTCGIANYKWLVAGLIRISGAEMAFPREVEVLGKELRSEERVVSDFLLWLVLSRSGVGFLMMLSASLNSVLISPLKSM